MSHPIEGDSDLEDCLSLRSLYDILEKINMKIETKESNFDSNIQVLKI